MQTKVSQRESLRHRHSHPLDMSCISKVVFRGKNESGTQNVLCGGSRTPDLNKVLRASKQRKKMGPVEFTWPQEICCQAESLFIAVLIQCW
jgi:hypothetical protein